MRNQEEKTEEQRYREFKSLMDKRQDYNGLASRMFKSKAAEISRKAKDAAGEKYWEFIERYIKENN